MNTQRTVFNKIAQYNKKEELASQKVELRIDELKKIASQLEQHWKDADKTMNIEGKKFVDLCLRAQKPLNDGMAELYNKRNEFAKTLERLGFEKSWIDKHLYNIDKELDAAQKRSMSLSEKTGKIRNII